jgi:hypothetical protein
MHVVMRTLTAASRFQSWTDFGLRRKKGTLDEPILETGKTWTSVDYWAEFATHQFGSMLAPLTPKQ